MPTYKYAAINAAGKRVEGTHIAKQKDEVLLMLRKNNSHPIFIEEVVEGTEVSFQLFNKVKVKDIALFCRQFHAMLNAGVTLVNSLDILRVQTANIKMRKVIEELYEDVQKGMAFSEAMSLKKKVFPELLINMVRSGELSGSLDTVMARMASHYENENRINNKVKSAMIYPAFIAVLATCAVIFLLIFVFPTFLEMFEGNNMQLPAPTKVLLAISKFITGFWYLIILAIALGIFLYGRYVATDEGRYQVDKFKMNIPVINDLQKKLYTAKFTRTLSTMISNGIPLLQAMEAVSKVVGNKVVERALGKTVDEIKKGVNLSAPIKQTGLFPPMVYYMINIGEESGSLDDLLDRTATFYDEEVEESIKKVTSLIEPLMILGMALVVGFIVIAMAMPMFDMLKAVNG